jgi:hypothetical protein
MLSLCSGVRVRLVGAAAGSVSSPFWARTVRDVELVKVMGLECPVSPGSDDGYGRCLTSA